MQKLMLLKRIMTVSSILVPLLSFLVSTTMPGCSNSMKDEAGQLQHIVNLSQLNPKFNPAILTLPSCFVMDKTNNFYLCDGEKHRILKFAPDGRFIKQIGRIGQDAEGMYYPGGLGFHENTLYVLDYGGVRIKTYDTEGNFLKAITFDQKNVNNSNSIVFDDSQIYLDMKYKVTSLKNINLISAFSLTGEKTTSFGRIIRAKMDAIYRILNKTRLVLQNKKIYGAFQSSPIIFCYDLGGKELLYKDLSTIDFDEQTNSILRDKIEDPNKDPHPKRVKTMNYITGFSMDDDGNYLLAINDWKQMVSFILILDQQANPLRKIHFSINGSLVFPIQNIYRSPAGGFYILGNYNNRDIHLLKWLKNDN